MPPTENLADAREQLLDEVLASYLKAAQAGRAPERQTLLDNHPELANELADFFADQDHVERLAAPLRTLVPAFPALTGATLNDYELLDEIARGGMGVVYRARQKGLNRIVALKVLLAGSLMSSEQGRRFQAEAEAIASLDHPNIVPVYEVGLHEGLPYFSMKLFEGGSLAKAIGDPRSPIGPSEAAHLLAAVADAVQYAHERGILHRDLKPANILLTNEGCEPRGEELPGGLHPPFASLIPVVSDFGLAKRITGEPAVTPRDADALTVSGAIVGTPSYMAPEQAAGSRVLTTAADVYGLGAILYELLTGRPPFRGDSPFDTLRRLQEEEPAPPRSLNPRLARDLETICLKCLQKEPSRRYVSARDLARDLRHYLASEPIEARPVGRLERLGRWCRRRPIAAGTVLAFVLVIVGAFVLVDAKRREARHSATAKDLANRDLADSRDKARRAIDEFCRVLSTDDWSEDPASQEKRKRLLEKGLAYYRHFLDDPHAEAPARSELVQTWFRIGDISNALGKPEQALDAFTHARFAAEMLLRSKPDDAAIRTDLARIHNRLGMLHKSANRSEAALQSYRQAHDLLVALRRAASAEVPIEGELAVTCNNLGNLYRDRGQLDRTQAYYREGIDINRALRRVSSDLQYTYALALGLGNLALSTHSRGQREEAWRHFDEANRLMRQIVRAEPHIPRYRQGLGDNLLNQGVKLCVEKRHAEAVKTMEEGRDVLTRLVDMQPRIPRYQNDLARLLNQLGRAYGALGEKDKGQLVKSAEAYRESGKVYQGLAAKNPRSAEVVHRLASSLFDLGVVQAKLNRKTESIRSYQEVCGHGRRLVQAAPNHLSYRNLLGLALNNLGHELCLLKRSGEASTPLREALEHNRFVRVRSPSNDYYRRVLNTTFIFLADVYRDTSQREELVALLRERRDLWPDNAEELCIIACDLARARADDEAMRTLKQAIAKGFKDVKRLENEAGLNQLRQREDFRKLLQESKAK